MTSDQQLLEAPSTLVKANFGKPEFLSPESAIAVFFLYKFVFVEPSHPGRETFRNLCKKCAEMR